MSPRSLSQSLFLACSLLSAVPARAFVVVPVSVPALLAFSDLLGQMRGLASGRARVQFARDLTARGERFTCAQIVQLMRTSAFPDEQVDIAVALYPAALDPGQSRLLIASLADPADQARLRVLLRGGRSRRGRRG